MGTDELGVNLFFHEGRKTKNLYRKLLRDRAGISWDRYTPKLPPEEHVREIPRPKRTLQSGRVHGLPIHYSAPPLPLPDGFPTLDQCEKDIMDALPRGYCRFRINQFLTKLRSFSPATAGRIARDAGICGGVSPEEVEGLQNALRLEEALYATKDIYYVVVDQDKLEGVAGDWHFFDQDALEWLPMTIKFPKRFIRREYFVRRHTDSFGNTTALDFHSFNFQPLFILPLPPLNKLDTYVEADLKKFEEFLSELDRNLPPNRRRP